jgi:hypothetical protein
MVSFATVRILLFIIFLLFAILFPFFISSTTIFLVIHFLPLSFPFRFISIPFLIPLSLPHFNYLRGFANTRYWLRHVRLSLRLHGKIRLPQNRFSWHFEGHFYKNFRENSEKDNRHVTWRYMYIYELLVTKITTVSSVTKIISVPVVAIFISITVFVSFTNLTTGYIFLGY